MKAQDLITFGGTLTTLGIVFGSDRLIGYGFIGAGVLVSIIGAIQARNDRGDDK
jgi:hypothetical protein